MSSLISSSLTKIQSIHFHQQLKKEKLLGNEIVNIYRKVSVPFYFTLRVHEEPGTINYAGSRDHF